MSQPTKAPGPIEIIADGAHLDFAAGVLSVMDYGGAAKIGLNIDNATKLKDGLAAWIAWKKSDQPPPHHEHFERTKTPMSDKTTRRINLNDRVRAKVGARGLEAIEEYIASLEIPPGPIEHLASLRPDETGHVCLPLWKIARIFGHRMGCGPALVIDPEMCLESSVYDVEASQCGATCPTPICDDWRCDLPKGHGGKDHSMECRTGRALWPVEEPPVDALAAAERRAKTHLLASMRHLARPERAERALRVIREGTELPERLAVAEATRDAFIAQAHALANERDEARELVRRLYGVGVGASPGLEALADAQVALSVWEHDADEESAEPGPPHEPDAGSMAPAVRVEPGRLTIVFSNQGSADKFAEALAEDLSALSRAATDADPGIGL